MSIQLHQEIGTILLYYIMTTPDFTNPTLIIHKTTSGQYDSNCTEPISLSSYCDIPHSFP